MIGRRELSRWVWPAVPAVVATMALAASDLVGRRCPPYTTALPPHPEQCLPTLLPEITGAALLPVLISWVVVAASLYAVILLALWGWQRQSRERSAT